MFGEAHSRYTHYANAKLNRSGRFRQNRLFSCALDGAHLWVALRYVERNPVRSGLVAAAWNWEWSSAVVHAGRKRPPDWLAIREWRGCLALDTLTEADLALRVNTYSSKRGRPPGRRSAPAARGHPAQARLFAEG